MAFHKREFEPRGYGEKRRVHAAAPNHVQGIQPLQRLQGGLTTGVHLGRGREVGLGGEYDVPPIGQRTPELVHDALVRTTSHEDRFAVRQRFKVFQIFGDMPREFHPAPDYPIRFRYRGH